ncbi:23S rRNA (uracil(1939)-C(5))-methyltransferase RlmD [Catenisphaera adipataccumulans]|jgi:23S rRNA (uracil1939-C5)-methyltransferase|uniref:23S rRNA (Uracil-5-)-methyltransferase RumA n=1 Tax=Catenisphaera adipataccumulans TaxID=700500 RepID=A0A7W8CY49_9FIRM|nr:23S rRNA (uracil(1939)-C(5))-methyltransferase RlmD [Catenisphaera adipataccumulans]MBB5183748.1 23S rRNA (uracil-5-)-methyltransferase RumA [Catenisphaera adipataccumulans]
MEKNIIVHIKKWGINGEGIAFMKRKPVFVPGAIPGETAEIQIIETKPRYQKAELIRILESVPARRYPLCPHQKECGGCALMHVRYKNQCRMKEQILKEALHKYAGYKGRIDPIVKNSEPLNYRNACKLPVRKVNGRWQSGMYAPDTNRFCAVDRCYVHDKDLELVRQQITEIFDRYPIPEIKTLVLKSFDHHVQVIVVTGKTKIAKAWIDAVSHLEPVVSIWQSIKTDSSIDPFGSEMIHLYGQKEMTVHLNDITCSLLPRSFFQLNTEQALRLYQTAAEWTPQSRCIVEAYSGIGAISLFVRGKGKEIIGIESIPDAVENANANAKRNGCDHIHFLCGDAAEKLKEIHQTIDTLIVDPPRSGLSDTMLTAIREQAPATILYISCNPSTLAKNISKLSQQYQIERVRPFDLFSQTPHVETICLLTRAEDR